MSAGEDYRWEWFESLDDSVLIDRLESRGFLIVETRKEHERVIEVLRKNMNECMANGKEKTAQWYDQRILESDIEYRNETEWMIDELRSRGVIMLEQNEIDKLKCALDDIECVVGEK